jgi:hypothetical protein
MKVMSIKREDVDAGRVDFAEVVTGKKLPPVIRVRYCATSSSNR